MKRVVLIVALTAAAGCAHTKQDPNRVTSSDAVVLIKSNVPDANLFVDGRFVGPVGVLRGGVAMAAGKHRLEVRRDDYFSRYVELDLQRAEHKRIELQLAPVLP